MKKQLLVIYLFLLTTIALGQNEEKAYKSGEWLKFKMSYSGFLKAGNATLSLEETSLHGKKVLHATGKGWTTGMIKWFFKVDDTYESYFDMAEVKPYFFKRKIDEGGYKKHRHTTFNYNDNKAYVQDFLKQKQETIAIKSPQDMVSTFYFLRNYNTKNLKKGEEIAVDMFMDSKIYPFKLHFLGYEILETRFGKVKTQKFRPLVQAGRVFKAQESVTIWITADSNKIPIKMQASLAVGSLRAELEAYKGLAHPFELIFD